MTLSVDEAKQKYCPLTLNNPALSNIAPDLDTDAVIKRDEWMRCIPISCMAWKWTNETEGYCGMIPGTDGR